MEQACKEGNEKNCLCWKDFKTWNDMIYATLQHEFRQLETEGYQCLIIGDFNAHVGGPPLGIEGNHCTYN